MKREFSDITDRCEEPALCRRRTIDMMSNRILTAVTLVALCLHVLLGCCWHHSHRSEPKIGAVASAVDQCTCPSHSNSDDASQKGRQGHDEDHSSCDRAACTFYSPNNLGLELSVAVSFWLPVAATNNFASLLGSVRGSGGSAVCDAENLHVHESMHALKQVWLI